MWRIMLFCLYWFVATICAAQSVSTQSVSTLQLVDSKAEYNFTDSVEIFRDTTGEYDFATLYHSDNEVPWILHVGDAPSYGYTSDTIWMRRKLSISETTSLKPEFFLEVYFSLLDEVDAYIVEEGILETVYESGESRPFSARPINHRNFVFPISFSKSKELEIYLRIKSEGSLRLPISLWTHRGFIESEQKLMVWQGIFIGALVIMLFYNFVIAMFMRDATYFIYVVFIGAELLTFLQFRGLTYQFLWPGSPNWNVVALPFLIGVLLSSAATFLGRFLELKKVSPFSYKVCIGLLILGAFISIFSFIFPYTYMIRFASICMGLAIIFAMVMTSYLFYQGYRAARFVLLAWCVLVVSSVLFILNANGLAAPSFFIENVVQLGSILEIALLSLAFADRINIERQAKLSAQKALVETHREANEELERKVVERTSELEKVNSKLQELNTMDPLTGVKNRGYFDVSFVKEHARSIRSNTPLALIMLDIDHFKQINDTYGHQVGDHAIKHVASLVKSVAFRPSDAISRYGGEEFAIVLPNTDITGATTVAERLREFIEQNPLSMPDLELQITASLGVYVFRPTNSESTEDVLNRADEALYKAKRSGRNCVVCSAQLTNNRGYT